MAASGPPSRRGGGDGFASTSGQHLVERPPAARVDPVSVCERREDPSRVVGRRSPIQTTQPWPQPFRGLGPRSSELSASASSRRSAPDGSWEVVATAIGGTAVTKEIHAYRVWAVRNGERTLEVRLDQPNGLRIAIDRVTALRADPQVGEIEMREHLVLYGESTTPTPRRTTETPAAAPSRSCTARRGRASARRERGWNQVRLAPATAATWAPTRIS